MLIPNKYIISLTYHDSHDMFSMEVMSGNVEDCNFDTDELEYRHDLFQEGEHPGAMLQWLGKIITKEQR